MKNKMIFAAVAACGLSAAGIVSAAPIVTYTFENTPAATSTNPDITASSITTLNGSAITYSAGVSDGTTATQAISTNTFADPSNAFNFSLTVAPGFTLDLDSLSVFTRASNTGPGTSTLSIGGTPVGSFTNPTAFAADPTSLPLSLTGLTGTVNFSLAGSAPAANATSTFANTGSLRLDNLVIGGTVAPVGGGSIPEPASIGLLGLAGLTLVRRRRTA